MTTLIPVMMQRIVIAEAEELPMPPALLRDALHQANANPHQSYDPPAAISPEAYRLPEINSARP